ncbi:MAG: hypothetical protein AAB869_03705 [Patescibacteria group bacterium]
MKYFFFATQFALVAPTLAFAAAPTDFKEFAEFAVKVLQNIIGILFASLAVGLLYGVILYLFSSPSEKRRSEIKEMLLWGVIGIIVVMGIWGILGILRESLFGTSTVGIPFINPSA